MCLKLQRQRHFLITLAPNPMLLTGRVTLSIFLAIGASVQILKRQRRLSLTTVV